jgi:hypothetical protein
LLIKLNPSPLCITKCLTHVWIVTAFEYRNYPSDVGHRSSEAPLAYGSEFSVKLAVHRSHALIDPPSLWQNQPELHWLKYTSPLWRATSCFKRYNTIGMSGNVPMNHRTQDPTRYLTRR